MTCQVLLANSHGIAVASDTAVSVGSGIVHTGAKKVHPLGGAHRIAVVHAGNVLFHGIPFDVLIPEWAASLDDHPLETVAAYRESFLDWLRERAVRVLPGEVQDADALKLLSRIAERVWGDAKRVLRDVDPETAEEHFVEWIKHYRELWEARDDLELFEDQVGHETFLRLRKVEGSWSVDETFEYFFDDVPRSQSIDAHLMLLLELMFRRNSHSLECATLAFAGFGHDELFPGIAQTVVRSLVNDVLQARHTGLVGVPMDFPQSVCVRQGQDSAIESFLVGYSSVLVDEVAHGLDTVEQNPPQERACDAHGARHHVPVSDVLREKLDSAAQEHRMSKFWRSLDGLPTKALAETAKRLVNIQSLELLLHGEVATVSEECQVAVITKADGFSMIADAA